MKLELYIQMSETLILSGELRTALPPVACLVNTGQKRGRKRVTEEPNFGTPREQVAMCNESEDAREVSLGPTSSRRFTSWTQTVNYPENTAFWPESVSLRHDPNTGIRDTAHSIALRPRKMDVRNGVIHHHLSFGEGTNLMVMVERIVQKAKATGKAGGYADMDTDTQKIEAFEEVCL